MEYRYDAAGNRISKYVYNNSSSITKSIEYIGGYVIENDILSYYSMAEGRVRNEGGGFGLVMKMEYFITDQQGNVRVSFEDNGSGGVALRQENSYYAFGMQMASSTLPTVNPNKKLYNAGSEWQDDIEGLADYYSTFFREYDPIIGRFNGVDPMSESFESWTTYHYSYNNPVNFNDPMGDYAAGNDMPNWIREMQAEYKAWHDSKYGDNSSRATVERTMAMWGFGDWTGGEGGGGYEGSYQQLKDNINAHGHEAWRDNSVGEGNMFKSIASFFKKLFGSKKNKKSTIIETIIEQFYEVIDKDGKIIGKLNVTIKNYSEDTKAGFKSFGVKLSITYQDKGSEYTDFNWIQTVKTNFPLRLFENPSGFEMTMDEQFIYNDGHNPPYYYPSSNWIPIQVPGTYTAGFFDDPTRFYAGDHWEAKLTLMGGNGSRPNNPMFSLHYGFNLDRRGVNIITPTAVSNNFDFKYRFPK